MGNFSAVLVMGFSYCLVLFSPTLRSDRSAIMASWLTITLHHAAAIFNIFVTPLSSTWGDLYDFHKMGTGEFPIKHLYGYFLYLAYKVLGPSIWLGSELSIVAYTLSLIVFAEILTLLGARKNLSACIIVYGLLPSAVVHCSVTMRESYQMLAYLGALCALLKLRQRFRGQDIAALLLCLFVLARLHQSLVAFCVLILVLGLPWALSKQGLGGGLLVISYLLVVPAVVPIYLANFEGSSETVKALQQGQLLEYAATYRDKVERARSDYGFQIDTSGPVEFLTSTSLVILMYFVAPLPWQVELPMDYYAFLEVMIRIALFYGAFRVYARSDTETRSRMAMIGGFSVVLEFMWGVGTSNWGTSLRHHLVAYGPFVALGAPYWVNFTLDPASRQLKLRREKRRLREAGASK